MVDFVIVSQTRSGSTMLDSAFDNCDNISSFGECTAIKQPNIYFLNSKRPIIKQLRNYHFNHSLYSWYTRKYSKIDNINSVLSNKIINQWFDWIYSLNDSVGMKLLYESFIVMMKNGIDLQSILNDRDVKVVFLKRCVSDRIKSIRNKWKWEHLSDEYLIKQHLDREDDLKKWFSKRVEVTFEELTNNMDSDVLSNEPTKRIFDYLGIEFQSLIPKTKRTVYEII